MHYAFDDATQRARWSNFPTGFVARDNISLKQMSTPQQQAAMKLMGTVRSPMGLEKVNEIRQADNDFKTNGSKRRPGGGAPRPPRPPPGGQGGPPPQFGGRGPDGPGGAGRPSAGWQYVWQQSLFHLVSWNPFGNKAMDAAIRRAPPGIHC